MKNHFKENKARWFIFTTFLLSWLLWIPMAISGHANQALLVAGAFIPSIIGIVLTASLGSPEERKNFTARATRFSMIKPVWYLFILCVFPLTMLFAYTAVIATGGTPPSTTGMLTTLTHPSQLALFIVIMLIGGPLAEEFGWRGYLLDRLLQKYTALTASLVLGVIWAAWHLPLFFMKNTIQGAMGVASPGFFIWTAQVIAMCVIYTWVYNHTHRSIISAILLHFMWNSTGTIISGLGNALSADISLYRMIFLIVFAGIIIAVHGPQHLCRDTVK